jgi:hypothetical protein
MSVAAVQENLHSSGRAYMIELGPHLKKLCTSSGGIHDRGKPPRNHRGGGKAIPMA